MPSVNRLVENTVTFVASNVQYQRQQNAPKPQTKMLREVQQSVPRPHCTAAIKKVQDPIFFNETQTAQDSKLAREAHERTKKEERYLKATNEAIVEEAR